MSEITIVKVQFKYMKDGERLWNSEECRNYLYHLGLIPIKRVLKKNGIYTYVMKETDDNLNVIKDDNQISLFYLD